MGSGIHQKTSIYLATLIAAIALSGCGEKKEVRGTPPPAEAPKSTTTVDNTASPDPEGGGVPLPGPDDDASGGSPSISPTPGETEAPPILKDPLDEEAGYEPVDPMAIESTDFEKRYTGMESPDGLFYTGSSTDKLLTYLRLRNEDPYLDAGVKTRNLEAARSIRSARLDRDQETGDIVLTLKIKEGKSVKNYVLAGGLEGATVSKLRLTKGRSGTKTTGDQFISGKIKCMDDDGGCETVFARLVLEGNSTPEPVSLGSTRGSRAAVAILFRKSLADIRASLSKSSGNPEYENIRAFFINSHYNANTDMKLREAVLSSFEVVNGRSGFEVQIIGENRQLISLGGPLLAPDAGTSVDITADRTPSQMQDSLDLDSIMGYHLDLANFIGSAKIVNNNGLGQVRIALKMRKRVGYGQEAFRLTIMRIIKPTLEPNEDNLNLK